MSHSFAETLTITCGNCGRDFDAEFWLVVDTVERPDLLQRIRDGDIHAATCPHCGDPGSMDAPLLLFRPDLVAADQPLLLFSPAQDTSAEEDQEQLHQLVDLLRTSLGDVWQDDWVANGVRGASRPVLPALLSDDPEATLRAMANQVAAEMERLRQEDPERFQELEQAARQVLQEANPLLVTLEEFIQADTWPDTRRVIDRHPELLSDEAEAVLKQLIGAAQERGDVDAVHLFEDHFALLVRCQEVGTARAFAETMLPPEALAQAEKEGIPPEELLASLEAADAMPTELREILAELAANDREIRSPEDLERALAEKPELVARLEALEQASGSQLAVPPQFQNDLRQAREAEQRYLRSGDRSALDGAAAAWMRILEHPGFPSSGRPFRLAAINDAGSVLLRRYWARGRLADLDQALGLWQEVVQQTPADSPNLPGYLTNLGGGLSGRYAHTGRLEDLEGAIRCFEQAVQAAPAGSSDLPTFLTNLGTGLSDLYARTGRLEDLQESIRVYQQAIQAAPADSPALPSILNNLGISLRDRYARTGQLEDLEEAIRALLRAIRATPASSPDLPARLTNLGANLRDRYRHTGRLQDLEEAIRVYQQAVQVTPADSPALPIFLTNLGTGLSDRYARTGQPEDLAEAVWVYQQAVQKTPAGSPDLPSRLTNLGTGLRGRYARTGRLEDLEEAIQVYQQAVQATPADSPALASILNNLANGLSDRYASTSALEDLEEAIQASEEAVQHTPADSPKLPMVLNNLGDSLHTRYTRAGRPQDLAEATGCWERASLRGLEASPEEGLRAARNWMVSAFERQAWGELLKAYGYARQTMDTILQIQWDRAAKESWLREVQGLPALVAYGLARLEQPQEAVAALEAGRARLLAEVLEQSRRDLERLPELGQADLLESYRQAAGRIQALQQQVGQRAEPGEQRPGSGNLAQEMEAARAELNAAIAAIRQVEVDGQRPYADFLLPPVFAEIQLAATPGAPLVYLVTTPAGSLVLLLAADEVEILWMDDLNETQLREALFGPADDPALGGYLGAYGRWRENPRSEPARKAWFEVLDTTSHWLWDVLVGPLVEFLGAKGVNQATLIPTGSLGLLPLHATWTEDASAPSGRRYALDSLTLTYAPSASAVATSREAAGSVHDDAILAVDNPDGSLVFSGQEVEAVLSYFPDAKRHTLRGKAAIRQAVLQELPAYPVLHFSTHGWAGWSEPLESGLLMSSEPHLTLRDLLDLRLQGARLAVLSACETGIPGTQLPDEVVSLPTGLVQAGVAGVVASLWSVNDLSTAMLMERFYRLWREEGLAPAEALRQAQVWLRDTTNREKAEYFQQDVPALAGLRMPAEVAADMYVDRMLSQNPDARDFAHPFWWAAFSMTGA